MLKIYKILLISINRINSIIIFKSFGFLISLFFLIIKQSNLIDFNFIILINLLLI